MVRPSLTFLSLGLLFAPVSGWACMCMDGHAMDCAPGDPDPCASAHHASANPARNLPPETQTKTPPLSPEAAGILKEPPKLPCDDGKPNCFYSEEQLQVISKDLSEKYKGVKLEDVGVFRRFKNWIVGNDSPARDLGEAATRALQFPEVRSPKAITEQKMNGFIGYLDKEGIRMAEINKSKDEISRQRAIRAAMEDLKQNMSPEVVGPELHHGLMKSGDYLTNKAMRGQDYAEKEPAYSGSWGHWAEESLNNGRYGDAAKQASRALELDPNNAQALSIRAGAEFKQGDLPAAANDAKAALQINPKDKDAFSVYQLSAGREATSGSGTESQAASPGGGASGGGASGGSASGAAPAISLTSPALGQSAQYAKKAQTALSMGDRRAAIDHASRALELNAENLAALSARAAAYNALGNHAAALKDSVASLRLAPKNGVMLNAKAYALNKQKQYQEALDAANAALALDPRDASALANKGYALGGMGDKAGMLAALKTAASIDPRFETSLKSALQSPADGDVIFLFPGEDRASGSAPAAAAPSRAKRFAALSFSTVIGGLLLGLGVLPIILPPLARRVKTFITERATRHPAVSAKAPEDGSRPRDGEPLKKI